jgi:hypothetical protein
MANLRFDLGAARPKFRKRGRGAFTQQVHCKTLILRPASRNAASLISLAIRRRSAPSIQAMEMPACQIIAPTLP